MPSHRVTIDGLMCEIRAVRAESLRLDARVIGARLVSEIDGAIARVGAALDVAVATPDDEEGLTTVCEAIVVARERIESVRLARARARPGDCPLDRAARTRTSASPSDSATQPTAELREGRRTPISVRG
jgi:hypothetical protein